MRIKYNKTGSRARSHLVRYNGTEGLDREFNIVPAQELRDVNKKYYVPSPDGKYLKTKFAIGFEVEKLTVRGEEEYPLFRGMKEIARLEIARTRKGTVKLSRTYSR